MTARKQTKLLSNWLRSCGAWEPMSLEQFARLADEHGRIQATRQELGQRLEKAFGTAPGESGDWRRLLEQLPLPGTPALTTTRPNWRSCARAGTKSKAKLMSSKRR